MDQNQTSEITLYLYIIQYLKYNKKNEKHHFYYYME